MEVSDFQEFPLIRSSDVFKTYVKRFARMMYLRKICDADHPVLSVELELVEMAKSRLQEFILSRASASQVRLFKPVLESWIRSVALEQTLNLENNDKLREEILEDIRLEDLSDILPIIH